MVARHKIGGAREPDGGGEETGRMEMEMEMEPEGDGEEAGGSGSRMPEGGGIRRWGWRERGRCG